MKQTRTGALAIGMFLALASAGVFAQGADTPASAPAAASMSPQQSKAANRALQRKVVRALEKTKGLTATAIAVRARDGAVTLSGTVPQQDQVDLATASAMAVPGVTSVRNTLALSTF